MLSLNQIRRDEATVPTEAQMKLAIAQTLSMPFAYNAPVIILDFDVTENGNITGRFKDAARPRVFSFELDGESVSYQPYKPGKMDSLDSDDAVIEWEEFSAGYSYRVDAGIGNKKKPQCVKPTAYNCGSACININKNCKSSPEDNNSKDRLEKLNIAGKEYAKTTKTNSKAKVKPGSKEPIKEKLIGDGTHKGVPKIGDGTHEGVPKNAQEYQEAMAKNGKQITLKEAQDTVDSIKYWTGKGSYIIREDQKLGKDNEDADRIDEFIKNSTPYKGEIYRGLYFSSREDALKWAKGDKDGILGNQSAHASWTSDFKIASQFSTFFSFGEDDDSVPVVIKSINKSGVSIRNLSMFDGGGKDGKDEKEVIVSKGTRHKVKNVKEENGVIVVEVEEVEASPKKNSVKQKAQNA